MKNSHFDSGHGGYPKTAREAELQPTEAQTMFLGLVTGIYPPGN